MYNSYKDVIPSSIYASTLSPYMSMFIVNYDKPLS